MKHAMNVIFVVCEDWSSDTGIDRRRGAEGADPPTRLFAIHRRFRSLGVLELYTPSQKKMLR